MPRPKVFTVGLSDVDRAELTRLVTTGSHPARMIMRARVLLELDENAGPVADRAVIADRVGVAENTVRLVARRFVETDGDVEVTISRKQRLVPPVPVIRGREFAVELVADSRLTPGVDEKGARGQRDLGAISPRPSAVRIRWAEHLAQLSKGDDEGTVTVIEGLWRHLPQLGEDRVSDRSLDLLSVFCRDVAEHPGDQHLDVSGKRKMSIRGINVREDHGIAERKQPLL